MSKISDRAEQIARPIVEENGCRLWDVEYVREAGTWYLRVFIDKDDGVSINDCEIISRQIDPILDREDFIPDSYVFEVSSAGAERELKRPRDFERFMGSDVEVRLYRAEDGSKTIVGKLTGYSDGAVTVSTSGTQRTFEKGRVAKVRLRIV